MTSLLDFVNKTREDAIVKYHGEALTELEDKIFDNPFALSLSIVSGCVNKQVTEEIIRRLNVGGIKSKLLFIDRRPIQYYIEVEIPLPGHLNHDEPIEEQ